MFIFFWGPLGDQDSQNARIYRMNLEVKSVVYEYLCSSLVTGIVVF